MLLAALVLLGSLALGAQVVSSSKFDTLKFSSIEQCGSFNVSFVGSSINATSTLTLTILPFNSSSIPITIPPSSWDSASGAAAAAFITFLPIPAGSTFIATLDDAGTGEAVAAVSDIIKIEDSDDTSCLPSSTETQLFSTQSTLSQCESFNVSFSNTSTAPTVRAFVPNFFSETLNQTSTTSNTTGVASYILPVFRGFEVAFLFEDDDGNHQVSNLYPVGGDASSSTSCFPFDFTAAASSASATPSPGGLSSAGAVAIGVVSGTVVGTMLILLGWFFWRERRRRLARKQMEAFVAVKPSLSEKEKQFDDELSRTPPPYLSAPRPSRQSPPQIIQTNPAQSQSRYLANPPYRPEDFSSPTSSRYSQNTRAKLYSTADSGVLPDTPAFNSSRRTRGHDPNNQSIETLDIEGMLEAATIRTPHPTVLARERAPTPDSGIIDGATVFASPRIGVSATPTLASAPAPVVNTRILSSKRSDENLDVPLSATDFGRFSDVVMDYPREALTLARGESPNIRGRLPVSATSSFTPSFDEAGPGGVRDSGGYATFKANLASRPVARRS
ncbi:uncharacterized protein STEHIDRAFT_169105 [Stereum hirsutum FP-91666 SS1]|uniref:uncharacterized protein n=1 Tax=Stereum hirsutum (strain FP-91666) TaxID=721885 RepID=UPI000444A516|nr:uncharacterized protein STEHIDRAFT_169105 [Stereum hirsutum FP-91666 SS1]EIM86117.1 hypothetical protein STEHIDRAFT_169105 [Stereum hirsutum FP-91666 SS1]